MEMVAMLNGLGNAGCRSCGGAGMAIVSGPAFGRLGETITLSEEYKLIFDRINASETEEELVAIEKVIDAKKDAGALVASEASALKVRILTRREQIGPIYKRWWYWPAVAGVVLVGWHLYKKNTTGRGLFE